MAEQRSVDDELRQAYQAWMQRDRAGHLDDGAWQRLGAGDAAQSERDLLFAHIVTCCECSAVWRSIAMLRTEAEGEGLIERRRQQQRSLFRTMLMPIAIAATVVLAVGSMIMMRQPAPPSSMLRGGESLSPVEGLMMAYDAGGTPTLVWTPSSAATMYRVEIFSEDGQPLWQGDVSAPPMSWPATVPRTKGVYRWRVEAHDGSSVIARSRLMVMELTR